MQKFACSGIDPAGQKQAIKKKEKYEATDSFGDIFREWHAHKSKCGRGLCRRDDEHVHR
jgi:hypothetical protein